MGKQKYESKYNLTLLAPNFVLGGRIINKENMRELADDLDVDHIINCAMELDDQKLVRAVDKSIEVFHCLWVDEPEDEEPEPMDPLDMLAALAWWQYCVAETLYDACKLPVTLVHCNAGRHRGPVMMTFLLAAITGQDPEEVARYIVARRPESDPWGVPAYRGSIKRALEMLRTGTRVSVPTDDDDDD